MRSWHFEMRRCGAIFIAAASLLSFLKPAEAQIMSVDLGHEFFKVALMRQGSPLEIVLNSHSKRKTPTTVSFLESIRAFGDDAMPHAGKAPAKVPMFYHSFLGENFTAADVQEGGRWWERFGLGSRFYALNLDFDATRSVPTFVFGEDTSYSGELVLANIFHFARKLAEETADGKTVRDVVATVQSGANMRQRQAIAAAAEIAGLRVLTVVNEGAAYAVHRAIDFQPEKGQIDRVLIYNMGARKAEVTIVQYESRAAGMVAGKTAPVVTILGSAVDFGLGGHIMDIKLAEQMLTKFQEKFPKLADGVAKNPRALRKLLTQADKTKMVLSANKAAPFIVESLYEDTDFQTTIQRADFEEMCQDLFDRLTTPIDAALEAANITMKDINEVEVVGGAWRTPKVQQLLSEYIESKAGKKLPLGQHLNGEEAGALGAALIGANSSSSFRVKKIFFTDVSAHDYAVQVVALNGSWEKNVTTLYPAGSPLGSKKKVALAMEEDFALRLFEDGSLLAEYTISGLSDLMETKWKEFNLTGPVKVQIPVNLESSGIVEVKTPMANAEQVYWVNVTKEKPKPNATKGSNSTNATNATKNESTSSTESADAEEGSEEKSSEGGSEEESEETPEVASNASTNDTANETGSAVEDEEPEIVQKQKKKKHEKKLAVKRVDIAPIPLSEENITEAKKKFEAMAKHEAEVMAMAEVKNELEAAIYGTRDKLEREDIVKVSTEEQREEVSKLCTEYEDWMWEASTDKNEYDKRLTRLQELLGPIEERALELEARADLPDNVKETLSDLKQAYEQIRKDMPWVEENKTDAALKKVADFEEWWAKKTEKQDALPLHEAPAYTKVEVQEKLNKLQKELDKLKKIKKPKEPKKPKASKNSTSGDNATKSETPASDAEDSSLSSDPDVIQQELESVSKKKLDAVEKEDFDTAESLKKREQKLKDHLARLQKSEL